MSPQNRQLKLSPNNELTSKKPEPCHPKQKCRRDPFCSIRRSQCEFFVRMASQNVELDQIRQLFEKLKSVSSERELDDTLALIYSTLEGESGLQKLQSPDVRHFRTRLTTANDCDSVFRHRSISCCDGSCSSRRASGTFPFYKYSQIISIYLFLASTMFYLSL
jgi:hypothetical protein